MAETAVDPERERRREEEAWLRQRYPELRHGAERPNGPLGGIKMGFAREFAPWRLALPDDDVAVRRAGRLPDGNGWLIRYRFGRAPAGEFVDVFAAHRMTNDRLYRFHEDGSAEMLGASLDMMANINEETRAEEARFYALVREHGLAGDWRGGAASRTTEGPYAI